MNLLSVGILPVLTAVGPSRPQNPSIATEPENRAQSSGAPLETTGSTDVELAGRIWTERLVSLIQPLDHDASLVMHHPNSPHAYTYDQALAIVALSASGQRADARRIAHGLARTQLDDGSWYILYNLDGSSPFPQAGDMRFTGTVAWALIGLSVYHQSFGSDEFSEVSDRSAQHLMGLRRDVDDSIALPFNPTDLPGTVWDERQVFATEHAIDSYAALELYTMSLNRPIPAGILPGLRRFVERRWSSEAQRFNAGYHRGLDNESEEFYLDPQIWSLMALDLPLTPFAGGLETACMQLTQAGPPRRGPATRPPLPGQYGFCAVEYAPPHGQTSAHSKPAALYFALVQKWMRARGESFECRGWRAEDIRDQFSALRTAQPFDGCPSTSKGGPDVAVPWMSAEISAWALFELMDINPFRPFDRLAPDAPGKPTNSTR